MQEAKKIFKGKNSNHQLHSQHCVTSRLQSQHYHWAESKGLYDALETEQTGEDNIKVVKNIFKVFVNIIALTTKTKKISRTKPIWWWVYPAHEHERRDSTTRDSGN